MDITYSPAEVTDIDALCAISGEAFRNDNHTCLKAYSKGLQPFDYHAETMKPAFESWLPRPNVDIIVARAMSRERHDENHPAYQTSPLLGQPIGFIVWGKRGYDQTEEERAHMQKEHEGAKPSLESVEVQRGLPKHPSQVQTTEDLEALTNASMRKWMQAIMPLGSKCRYIIAISVLPKWQGRGIGSALIQWGTRKADEEGSFCWVHSSMVGRRAFERHDFAEFGTLEVDLDDFTAGLDQKEWGRYVWTYMLRKSPRVCR